MEIRKKIPFNEWRAVIICSLLVFISLGFCSSAISIYTVPVTEALGISRGAYATSSTVRFITMALTNLCFGALAHRFGTKKLMLMGFGSLIISVLICSFANGLPLILLGSLFLGAGLSFTSTTMVGTVINRNCKRHTGTFLGIALAMNGVGAAVARIILTPIINAHKEGFRDAYRIVALIMVALALVILFFYKEATEESNAAAPEAEEKALKKEKQRVLHKPYMLVALVCVFFTGLIFQSITSIADPHFKDNGIDLALVTTILSVYSISISATKSSIGIIYDRAGLRVASMICYGSSLVAIPALLLVSNSSLGIGLGFVYAIFVAIGLPLQTVMLPIIVKELFGERLFSRALGIFVAANTAGYAAMPIADVIFDLKGSYDLWIMICFAILVAITVAMNIVIFLSGKDKSASI